MTNTEIALQEFLGTPLAQDTTDQMGGEYAAKIAWLSGAAHVFGEIADTLRADSDLWPVMDRLEETGDAIERMLNEAFACDEEE